MRSSSPSAITTVYGEERGGALFPTVARASAGALMNVQPKPEYANVAQEVMRGFLLLGDKQQTKGVDEARALRAPSTIAARWVLARTADAR